MGIGLVGETINTGFLINARNATEHPSYDPQIDSLPGIDCRYLNLLYNHSNNIKNSLLVTNIIKVAGLTFTQSHRCCDSKHRCSGL